MEPQPLLDDLPLDLGGQAVPDGVRRVRRVQEDGRALAREPEHVHPPEQPELVARDEVGFPDQVRRADRPRPEAEMGDRHRPRLLGVDHEVALRVQFGLLRDDLHGVLVRPDRPVGAEPEEDGADGVV